MLVPLRSKRPVGTEPVKITKGLTRTSGTALLRAVEAAAVSPGDFSAAEAALCELGTTDPDQAWQAIASGLPDVLATGLIEELATRAAESGTLPQTDLTRIPNMTQRTVYLHAWLKKRMETDPAAAMDIADKRPMGIDMRLTCIRAIAASDPKSAVDIALARDQTLLPTVFVNIPEDRRSEFLSRCGSSLTASIRREIANESVLKGNLNDPESITGQLKFLKLDTDPATMLALAEKAPADSPSVQKWLAAASPELQARIDIRRAVRAAASAGTWEELLKSIQSIPSQSGQDSAIRGWASRVGGGGGQQGWQQVIQLNDNDNRTRQIAMESAFATWALSDAKAIEKVKGTVPDNEFARLLEIQGKIHQKKPVAETKPPENSP